MMFTVCVCVCDSHHRQPTVSVGLVCLKHYASCVWWRTKSSSRIGLGMSASARSLCHATSLLHRCFDGISEPVADEEVMGIEVLQPPVIFLTA